MSCGCVFNLSVVFYVQVLFVCFNFFMFVFHGGPTLFHHPSLVYSLSCAVVEIVACLFASPPPPTPFPMFSGPWPFLQSSPPPLLQARSPHPLTPSPPPACLSQLRGTHSLGASPRPWRQSCPFSLPPLCPGPGSGGPAYLLCSPPL